MIENDHQEDLMIIVGDYPKLKGLKMKIVGDYLKDKLKGGCLREELV